MSGTDRELALTCDDVREVAGAFVLGAMDAAEEAAVRAHLATCPDPHPEIAELGGVLPAFAETVPIIEPPQELKARIMAAAAVEGRARAGAGSTSPGAPATPVAFPGAAERAHRSRATGTWLLGIAAVLAIAVLGSWNLLLQNDLSVARSYEQGVAAVLQTAAQPGSLSAIMTGDDGTARGLAAVDPRGNVELVMQDLAPTSGASVYEAWVIPSNGVPAPLGSVQVGKDGTASLQASGVPTSGGIVLALTLEPGPGATKPTLPIIASGVASAAG